MSVEPGLPFRIEDDTRIPAGRYYDPGFFDLERERLWPRAWQVACRIEEIPQVGDYAEYTIVDQSILVVRVSSDHIKAYWNACRHRGAQLGRGAGRFREELVCPFHGWRWKLDGSCSYVHAERGFRPDSVTPDALRLRECRSETRWGLVFINMDPDAQPLSEALDGVGAALDPLRLDLMRVDWWQYIELEANWKVAQEAFLEAYHIMQSHPEIAMGARGEDFDADAFRDYALHPLGHGWQRSGKLLAPVRGSSATEWLVANDGALIEGARTWITERQHEIQREILARGLSDEAFMEEFTRALYEEAAQRNVPLPPPSPEQTGFCHVFPNTTLIAAYGHALIYKFRPNGRNPEASIFDVCAVSIPPADAAEPPRPQRKGPIPHEEWPFVLRQDIRNIELQQVGLRSRGFDATILSPRYEKMIANMHRALDGYLGL
jgi:phenylpropionate dioxygenase-like ring-hydroxylating dioxygenase large terminal subunit